MLTLLAETAAIDARRGTKGEAGNGGRPAARTLPATQGVGGRSVTMAARARLRPTAGCGRACTPRARRVRASDVRQRLRAFAREGQRILWKDVWRRCVLGDVWTGARSGPELGAGWSIEREKTPREGGVEDYCSRCTYRVYGMYAVECPRGQRVCARFVPRLRATVGDRPHV